MNHEKAFIITTSTGEGLGQLFLELGADALISCDGAEASEGDFLAAIESSGAESILLLPNGEASLRAAKRVAAELDFVRVMPTRSFPEGYATLVAIPRAESAERLSAMRLPSLTAIEIISEPSELAERYVAVCSGNRLATYASAEAALFEAVERLISPSDRIITLIVGSGVTNSRRVFVTERLGELYPDREIIVYIGGQRATEYYIALR